MSVTHTHTLVVILIHQVCVFRVISHNTHTKAGFDAVHKLLDQRKFNGQGVTDLRGALPLCVCVCVCVYVRESGISEVLLPVYI